MLISKYRDKMTEYRRKLNRAWSSLKEKYNDGNGTFKPRNEADIQHFLYHCLIDEGIKPQKIHVEYRKKDKRCDIVLGDLGNEKKEKLFIEIKFSHVINRDTVSNRWKRDLKKLKELGGDRKPTFVVFVIKEKKECSDRKTLYKNSSNRLNELERYAKMKNIEVLTYHPPY